VTVLRAGENVTGSYDCCVVGAGPVGLAFAMEAAEAGARVLLVDAGDIDSGRHDVVPPPGQRTEIVDAARHAPPVLTVREGVGGTSWLWGGRCVSLEPIDFESRDHVPHSGWPIGPRDVASWYPAAARHLDCGVPAFRSDSPDWPGLSEFTMSNLERWTRRPKLGPRLGMRVLAHPGVTALLNSRLIGLRFIDDDRIDGVLVRRGREVHLLQASNYVLAMGGLEVTRFLLAVQRRRPAAFGGVDGPLGRYYMGHATGSIADIVLDDPDGAADLDFRRDEHDTYVRRRFTLRPEAQRAHRVLNTSFYLDNPDFFAAEHRNPTLSAVFLALAVPAVGRLILSEAIRLRHVGLRPYRVGAHVGNILRRPGRALWDIVDILRRRYLSAVRKPGFLLRTENGRYALHYHGEQVPNPESRITLQVDERGAELLRVDFRYVNQDIESLLRCHELLDEELRRAGIGHLVYRADDEAGIRAAAWAQTTDGFHSIGTTRMSSDPVDGVVDPDCRVHGIDNLYIASSSVLPTSAEANPTFFTAVLAVRLAHHLADRTRSGLTSEDSLLRGSGRSI
jgi:hypothetical protein